MKFKCGAFELKATRKVVVAPFQRVIVSTIAATELETSTGITESTLSFSRKFNLMVTPALSQLQDGRTTIQVTKPNAHTFTIRQGTIVADFKIFTPKQASHARPMSLEQLAFVSSYPDEATNVINQLFQSREAPTTDKRWYPTHETCEDPADLNNIKRRIYDETLKLLELENLEPTVDDDQRKAFLDQFSRENSQLTQEEQAMIERLLVKWHRTFARHRLDIEIKIEFKIKLILKHDDSL